VDKEVRKMNKYAVVLAAAGLFIFASLFGVFADDITWDDIGNGNLDLKSVLVDADNPRIIYIGSSNAVFKSEDGGETWRNILSVRGQKGYVNFLLFGPRDKNSLYAATANGLFYSANQGRDWRKIFQGKNYLENECTTLAILPDAIYLGTRGGLFISEDNGRSWHKGSANTGKADILAIACDIKEPDYIYVACAEGVFKTKDAGQSWDRVFIGCSSAKENNDDIEEEREEQNTEESAYDIRYLTIDPNNLSYLYLATSKGVYKSQDRGRSWEPISSYGLLSQDVRFLLVSDKSRIYAATKSGVFEYGDDRWQELSLRLLAGEIRSLSQDNQDNLYAACDNGLFKTRIEYPGNRRQDNSIAMYYKDEPDISEVQQAAIKYAEVEPEKIARWRRQAKVKAILPKLTVGLDRSETTNYEIYTSATARYVYEGPYDKSDGWDVTLSWELGDLIWSDAQTSIDVRSRLMVELRGNILDEVTKIYFERLRVKMELNNLSLEERKKRFEKELKLQELAASLDALTGGYFSQRLKYSKK
jgi:photosystem II stability/assembly factor-like uncharacterized protein